MKRRTTLLLVLLAACGPVADPGSGTDPAAPADTPPVEPTPPPVEFEAPRDPRAEVIVGKQDFGRILQGDSPRLRYEVRNVGEGALVIERFKASCGCTDVEVQPREVAPGQSCYVDVTFNSRGRHGKQNRTITLFTNDPESPRIRLLALADVYQILNPEPEELEFGDVLLGDEATASVVLTASDGSDFKVTGIDCPDPAVAFEWTRLEDPVRYRIDARVSPDAPLGWSATVTAWARVEHEKHDKIKLPMHGLVKLPVRIEPETSLDMGTVLPGAPVEKTVHLTNLRKNSPLPAPEVNVVSSVNRVLPLEEGGYAALVTAEVKEVEAGQRYDILVRVDDRVPPAQFVALLQLKFGDTSDRPHTIAVRGVKRLKEGE